MLTWRFKVAATIAGIIVAVWTIYCVWHFVEELSKIPLI